MRPLMQATAIATILSLTALAGCSPDKATPDPAGTPTAAGTPPGSALDEKTTTYIADAGQGAMYEIEAARIALERSKVPEVKAFAQTMLDYHTTAAGQLAPLAQAAAVTPPTALDARHSGMIEALRNASDADFDDRYIDQQTEALENARDLHKDYAENGTSENLKTLAGTIWPNAEMYLGQVKALDKSPADDAPHGTPTPH